MTFKKVYLPLNSSDDKMNNQYIIRKSLADEVAAKIQQQISLGQYQVHEKLPTEPELMKSFGVGRSTIREAIRILANSELLRVQQGVGTFVKDASDIKEPLSQRLKRANAQDVDEVRKLLEMKIAEKAAHHRKEEDITKMQHFLELRTQAAQTGKLYECVEADIQFHIAIAEASQNDILADLYKSFAKELKNLFLQTYSDTKPFITTSTLHHQLLKSIISQDAEQAWRWAAKIIGHITQ